MEDVTTNRRIAGSSQSTNMVTAMPQFFTVDSAPSVPSVREVRVKYVYWLIPYSFATSWSDPSPRNGRLPVRVTRKSLEDTPPAYRITVGGNARIVIVEADRADTIPRVSDPEIDRVVRAAFIAVPAQASYGGRTEEGARTILGGVRVENQALPVAAAFRATYRDASGFEASFEDYPITIRKGMALRWFIDMGKLVIDRPGTYTGKVVLTPDPDAAYGDPEIESIWDGTLEFPVSFTVRYEKR